MIGIVIAVAVAALVGMLACIIGGFMFLVGLMVARDSGALKLAAAVADAFSKIFVYPPVWRIALTVTAVCVGANLAMTYQPLSLMRLYMGNTFVQRSILASGMVRTLADKYDALVHMGPLHYVTMAIKFMVMIALAPLVFAVSILVNTMAMRTVLSSILVPTGLTFLYYKFADKFVKENILAKLKLSDRPVSNPTLSIIAGTLSVVVAFLLLLLLLQTKPGTTQWLTGGQPTANYVMTLNASIVVACVLSTITVEGARNPVSPARDAAARRDASTVHVVTVALSCAAAALAMLVMPHVNPRVFARMRLSAARF
jgi:hypothetical protein